MMRKQEYTWEGLEKWPVAITMSPIPHTLLTSDCDSLLKGKWGLCPLTLRAGRLEAVTVATLCGF